MPPLAGITLEIGSLAAAQATAVAMGLAYLLDQWRGRRHSGFIHDAPLTEKRERHGLEAEVLRLNRERTLARFENQLLDEILHPRETTSSVEAFLRRLVPQSAMGFAALFDVSTGEPALSISRGLTSSSRESFELPAELLGQLRREPWAVVRDEMNAATLFENLAASDRRKAREVFVIALRDASQLVSILVTTSLCPSGVPRDEQLGMTSRVGRVVVQRLQRDRELKQRHEELLLSRDMLELRGIAERATARPVEALNQFVSWLREATSMDRASVFLLSRRVGDIPEATFQCGIPLSVTTESVWKRHEAALALAAMTQQCGGLFDSDRLATMQVDTLIGSAAAWPLTIDGRLLGAMVLTRQAGLPLPFAPTRLIEWSAGLLASTVRRVYDETAIRRQARHDGLTDLANRRTFDTLLAGEVDRLRLGLSSECSLLFADLDHFKSVNDAHGHPAGDEVLRVTAQLLREHVSRLRVGERSVLARYGGEELAVLLPGVGLAGALRLAEEIRTALEQREFVFGTGRRNVTISIGAASCPRHAMTADDLVGAADRALYRAKAEGRNRVCMPCDVPT